MYNFVFCTFLISLCKNCTVFIVKAGILLYIQEVDIYTVVFCRSESVKNNSMSNVALKLIKCGELFMLSFAIC